MKNEKCKKILLFEVPSSTDYSTDRFKPNYFVDIKKSWKIKKKALYAYKEEIINQKTSRSVNGIYNLALHRGNISGLEMSEAFELFREIKKWKKGVI